MHDQHSISLHIFRNKIHISCIRKIKLKNYYAPYWQFSWQTVVCIRSSRILFMFGLILESLLHEFGVSFSLFLCFVFAAAKFANPASHKYVLAEGFR
jgi:hypothetical protein